MIVARHAVALGLLALSASCEPPPDLAPSQARGFEARQNHPNALVAARLGEQPLHYPLRFALLSDTHHPTGDAVFAQLREQMLELSPRPSFAVIIGDFVEEGTVEEHAGYIDIIDPYPIPIFSVIGNHEQWTPQDRKNYTTYYGPEDFSFDYAGSRFIALNDIVPRRDGLTDAQIAWLEAQLAAAPPNRFVLLHAPPPILPPPWGPPPFFNADRFYELVERFGVKLVACGHVHEFRYKQVNGVNYVESGGGGGVQDPTLGGLESPPDQAIVHNLLLVTIEADGAATLELMPAADSPATLPPFTLQFHTTPTQP